jgi:prepilin-type N-terminal cleavage/methylation domain-containing protein
MNSPGADAGFSLLEILVALAIASLVAMAIGGLFALTGTLRTRLSETAQLEAALVDVQGLAQLLSAEIGLRLADPAADGFELVRPDPIAGNQPAPLAQLRLAQGKRLEVTQATRVATAEVVAFESTGLEYLVRAPGGAMKWQPASAANSAAPIAVRLRLVLRDRVWRPLLWVSNSAAADARAASS